MVRCTYERLSEMGAYVIGKPLTLTSPQLWINL